LLKHFQALSYFAITGTYPALVDAIDRSDCKIAIVIPPQVLGPGLKAGDRVLFGRWNGTEVKIDGMEYLIMKKATLWACEGVMAAIGPGRPGPGAAIFASAGADELRAVAAKLAALARISRQGRQQDNGQARGAGLPCRLFCHPRASFKPRSIVLRAIPVARATALTPPYGTCQRRVEDR